MSKTVRTALRLLGIAILGSIAAYLNVNGHSAFWLWLGVFILFLALSDS